MSRLHSSSRARPRFVDRHVSVQVIDPEGKNLGLMPYEQAEREAARYGLNLVEVSKDTAPAVMRIMDLGRHMYEKQKKSVRKTTHVREIQMRPIIQEHDYQVKKKKLVEFLQKGDDVRFVVVFQGREMSKEMLQQKARELQQRVRTELEEYAKVSEAEMKVEGRKIFMLLRAKH